MERFIEWITHKFESHSVSVQAVTEGDTWCRHKYTCHSTPKEPWGHIVTFPIPSENMDIDVHGFIVRTKRKGKSLLLQVVPCDSAPKYAIRVWSKHVSGFGDQKPFKVLNIRNYKKG